MIFYFKTTTGPKPRRVAHTHSAHSACRGPVVEPSWPSLAWPTWHWPARERGPDRSAEAAHEVACSHVARARAGRGTTAARAKADRRSRRSCRQRPLYISDPARQGLEDQLEPDINGNERAVLTGGDALSSPKQRRTLAGGGWGWRHRGGKEL
jgi:hypothetical protein